MHGEENSYYRVSLLPIVHIPASSIKSSLHNAAVQANSYHKEIRWQQELFETGFNAPNWRIHDLFPQKTNTLFKYLPCAYVFSQIALRTSTAYKI